MGLSRKLLNLFCGTKTSDIGIFGSKYDGSPATSTDTDTIQDITDPGSNWLDGWSKAIVSSQAPCLEDMNGVMYVLSYMSKYLYQSGIPEWLGTESYNLYALTQYGGSLYMSIQVDVNGDNTNHNPSSSPTWWKKLSLITPWVAGQDYSVGDLATFNGRTYKCVVANTADSVFENDFYAGDWDDGNPAGTMLQNIAWQKSTKPYHYFDVTGTDAGKEVSKTTYAALYSIIGDYYNNCVNYSASTPSTYGNPASGNFRLPDFRNTFLKSSGTRNWGAGHNASHTHTHNKTASQSLAHSHSFAGQVGMSISGYNMITYQYDRGSSYTGYDVFTVPIKKFQIKTSTNSTSLSIGALSIYNQGSGSAPEPNYYGTKILLKY